MPGSPPRLLRGLRRLFPETDAGLSAYGDLLDEYRSLKSAGGRAGPGFWWRALRLSVEYGLWARLRARRGDPPGRVSGTAGSGRAGGMGPLADVRVAFRALLREPVFTLVAAGSIAIGIGATTSAFTVADVLLLGPVPGIEEPERAVELGRTTDGRGFDTFAYPDMVDLREGGGPLEEVAGWQFAELSLAYGGQGERAFGMAVTSNYFDAVSARPATGRTFADGEDAPGSPPVAVVSHGFWEGRLGGDPDVLGSTVLLNREPFTVVGVMSEGFLGHMVGYQSDIWIPISHGSELKRDPEARDRRNTVWLNLVGRLAPGATVEEADAAAGTIFARLAESYPETNARRGVEVIDLGPLPGAGRKFVGGFLMVLTALVSLVLVATCANVAGMLIARAAARERATAIRVALGAGAGRVMRQQLTESLLLFALGGGGGILLARLVLQGVDLSSLPLPMPVQLELTPHPWVMGLSAAVSLATGLLFGMAPAVQATRVDVVGSLKQGAALLGASGSRMRKVFVSAQVSVAVLVLLAAALFLRSLSNAAAVDAGFDPSGVYMTTVDLSLEGFEDPDAGQLQQQALLDRLEGTPGVEAASLSVDLPLDLGSHGTAVVLEGMDPEDPDAAIGVDFNQVSPGYFETLSVALLRGRTFDAADRAESPGVAIVSRTFADQVFPDQDVLGRRIRFGRRSADLSTIVGVVEDTKNQLITDTPRPFVYVPLTQSYTPRVHVAVRFQSGTLDPYTALTAAIRNVDPRLSITPVVSLAAYTGLGTLPQRLAGGVSTFLGAVGLLLATLGIYGVVAYSVTRKRRDIGVCMALGAPKARVLREVVGWGLRLIVPGTVVAVPLALVMGRAVQGFLIQVGAFDVASFGGSLAVVALAAAGAAVLPAWRASRVDPNAVLRAE